MTPVGARYRSRVPRQPRNIRKRTPQDAESPNGEVDSEPSSDDEEPTPETKVRVSDPEGEDSDSDSESGDEELPVVANQDAQEVEPVQGNNVNQPPLKSGFFTLSATRSPAQFFTISAGEPVLSLTPATPSQGSQSSTIVAATPSSQAVSLTSSLAVGPVVTTAVSSATHSSNALPVSSTLSNPVTSSLAGLPTEASASGTAQASTEPSPTAVAVGGMSGGQVAGAAVGGAAAIALVATGVFLFKKKRRRAAAAASPTPTQKENIRVVPPTGGPTRATAPFDPDAPLSPSALKFDFNAPRMPREEWSRSMQVLNSRVRAEYATQQEEQEPVQEIYEARVYMQ